MSSIRILAAVLLAACVSGQTTLAPPTPGDIMTGVTCGAGDAHSSGTLYLAFGFCEGGSDIAFTVKATNNGNIDLSPAKGAVVKFQTVITNYGNAFDVTSGIFTAPVDGMYLFSASMYNVFAGQKLDTDIVKNGAKEVNMYCSPAIQYSACSATVVLRLATGDRIWISDASGQMVDHDSSFMGVLLNS